MKSGRLGILTRANSIPLRQSAFDRLVFPANVNHSSQAMVHREQPSGETSRQGQRINSTLNLNLSLSSDQLPTTQYLSERANSGICSRCFSDKHQRSQCKSQIRCYNWRLEGYIAANCVEPRARVKEIVKPLSYSNGKEVMMQPILFSKTASVHLGPGASDGISSGWSYSLHPAGECNRKTSPTER